MTSVASPAVSATYDVAIIGAGPVGLLLGGLLGAKGIRVILLERRTELVAHSQAIGITPPSLQILSRLGLEEDLIAQGVKVMDCQIHGDSGHLGCVSFRAIPARHRFILSLPQNQTLATLQRKLGEFPSVTLRQGVEVSGIAQHRDHCDMQCEGETVTAGYVIGCDGSRSRVRDWCGLAGKGRSYGVHFAMGDFVDRTALNDEAHLFFTAQGSVESFPLPGGLRRWIVQTAQREDNAAPGLVRDQVRQRTPYDLPVADQLNQSAFSPYRMNCTRYSRGRVILCGDAAHIMSPIGGQGMNTGFADAEFLADALHAHLQQGAAITPLLTAYNHYRRRAAHVATQHAAWGMWLGTWTGRALSRLRGFIIRHGLCHGPLASRMGPYYAMLTIPYNTIDQVPLAALKSQSA